MIAVVSNEVNIAEAAYPLPFYYYEIPGMTNVRLSASGFLSEAGPRIPNLRGLKESGAPFAPPTYLYTVMLMLLIAVGSFRIFVQHLGPAAEVRRHRPPPFAEHVFLFRHVAPPKVVPVWPAR